MPAVTVNTGVSSSAEKITSIGWPSRLKRQVDDDASSVAAFSPVATLRATGRWPCTKFGLLSMYRSI